MSIYYVLSYKLHINVIGIISVQHLCVCLGICIHRACLLIAWLNNMGQGLELTNFINNPKGD